MNDLVEAPDNAGTAAAIPADRARSLNRWNLTLAGLHAVQGLAILALSFAKDPVVTTPVVSSYLTFDTATSTLVPAQRTLFDLPIGPAVALFFFLSAIAHLTVAIPTRGWYERSLARGQNPARWIEYAFSSSVMIVVIATLSGIQEIGTLVAIFGVNAAMILFGQLQENYEEPGRPGWLPFIFGCMAGIVPWIVIGIYLWSPGSAAEPPAFVYAIFVSLFIFFNSFALNMVLQYRQVGPWRDYLFGERVYVLLSLVAKSALAWQVFANTLVPT